MVPRAWTAQASPRRCSPTSACTCPTPQTPSTLTVRLPTGKPATWCSSKSLRLRYLARRNSDRLRDGDPCLDLLRGSRGDTHRIHPRLRGCRRRVLDECCADIMPTVL